MIYWILTKTVLKLKKLYKPEEYPLPGAFMYREDTGKDVKKDESAEQGDEEEYGEGEAEQAENEEGDGEEKFL